MKILVPLDGSEFAEKILKPAADLANRAEAEVHLIEVVTSRAAKSAEGDSRRPVTASPVNEGRLEAGDPKFGFNLAANRLREPTSEMAKAYLEGVARDFFANGTHIEVAVADEPAEAILEYVRRKKIDLIALATHGRTGRAKSLMGSVAADLLGNKAVPLLLVSPEKPDEI